LAIIDQVDVEFHDGFNVLTGETGAGKSILIGALNLLLGARSSADIIRTGEEEAQVEGLFEIPEEIVLPGDVDHDLRSTGELIITRRVLRSGRSRCSINGSLASLGMLQAVGQSLVSIFGQHEHHVLLDPAEHADMLDRFGCLDELKKATAAGFSAMKSAEEDLLRARKQAEEHEHQAQENSETVNELTAASLKSGEEEGLVAERDLLKKAVQIREKAFEAYHALYSRSGSLIAELSDVKKAVDYIASANPKFSGMSDGLDEAVYRLEDVALELRDVTETLHSDPARLEKIEERLGLIRRLKKKYGRDLGGLIDYLETLDQEAGGFAEAASEVKKLAAKSERARESYREAARELSAARRTAAKNLDVAMKAELKELAMPDARFTVTFTALEDGKGTADGLERTEFYLASNPGEDSRPLARVASGGELSRIMLALKALQVDNRGAGTVIFDEVDTGIGGHTASAVGTRLARVAARQQVLCVTHLHQIAALAHHHLCVRKSVKQGRTRIEVTPLDHDRRVEELTRMLGASPDSESVKEHVRRLMDSCPAAEV